MSCDPNFQPTPEHQWLQQLVGEWTYLAEAQMGPDTPPEKFTGTESVRSLGGLWTMGHGEGEMPGGGAAHMVMTLGYDPKKQRFVGSWIGSMMTNLWVYDGWLEGNILTLEAEGPSMAGDGTLSKYRDVIEILDANRRTLSSFSPNPDGTWTRFMMSTYTRK